VKPRLAGFLLSKFDGHVNGRFWPKAGIRYNLFEMKKVPTLKSAMIPFPYSVQLETTLNSVRKLMQEHNIHHIPVMNNGKIVGVITG